MMGSRAGSQLPLQLQAILRMYLLFQSQRLRPLREAETGIVQIVHQVTVAVLEVEAAPEAAPGVAPGVVVEALARQVTVP